MISRRACPDRAVAPGPRNDRAYGARRLRIRFMALLLLAALPMTPAQAESGEFEVRSASSQLVDGVYFVDARINYRLSEAALEALDSGFTLTIQLQINLTRSRRFWTDKEVASLSKDYELSYQPLSERYVVKYVNSGVQLSFSTLFAALNHFGRVVDLPVLDSSLLDPDGRYLIALRAVLDQNTLPGPLQMLAFWSDGFRLESDWYQWKLND